MKIQQTTVWLGRRKQRIGVVFSSDGTSVHAQNIDPEISEEVKRWLDKGFTHWVRAGQKTRPEYIPPNHPDFLERLKAYLGDTYRLTSMDLDMNKNRSSNSQANTCVYRVQNTQSVCQASFQKNPQQTGTFNQVVDIQKVKHVK